MDEVNSDAFNLLGNSAADDKPSAAMEDAYEMFLAELVFSPNDPRMDIIENYDRCADAEWMAWLDAKVKNSKDPEEKMALRDLFEMIVDIKQKMELSKQAEEREQAEAERAEAQRVADAEDAMSAGRAMSNADVLRQASKVDTAGVQSALDNREGKAEKKSFLDSELTPEIRTSYETLLKELLPPYLTGQTPQSLVFNNYDKCDAQFMKVLAERVANGDEDCKAIVDAISQEQQKRLEAATEKLKAVLSVGDPRRMEGAIVKLAKDGQVDEPFLLLLEANANQAEAAGASGPAQLMRKLRTKASEEKDKQTTAKEILLLRKLLRTEDSSEREKLLEDAFTPREQFLVAGTAENAAKAIDGEEFEEEKPMPDVPPPAFINACKAVLLNFGNLGTDEKGDLTSMVKTIAAEAEVVATKIYGKGMSPREQQDRAWKESSTSIFDLETLELEAESMGQTAPWANPDGGDDILPGFDATGKMKIGGT
eukprot:CAMPEP_0195520318 /NCGR_PEP_ID=MMETSP0794_2-20130614/16620_1 /TAXON_ID=515487 /ORGANISM="Stephanopyxis turris, Strain CCMP 815" /LENGTH=481 /DNA_ID=CAMNT_0040649653 /DNA_START=173 /DNA_END=1618 /DNA_ORIENTATION=+